MSDSFSLEQPLSASGQGPARAVLVTGAAGRIGTSFAKAAANRYRLRLMVRGDESNIEQIQSFGEVVSADLSDLASLKQHCECMDAVVHLAGDPDPGAAWERLLETNIVGAYNLFVAAKATGVRRLIYASSIHAVSGYPSDYQVHTNDPVNPGDLYGVSKCFGEALGRYMAEQEGLSVICIRIGGFQPTENMRTAKGIHMLDAWISESDMAQLICRCIDDEKLKFALFHGLSNNRFNRLDITNARELVGYQPQDDITQTNEQLIPLHLQETVNQHNIRDGKPDGIRDELKLLKS